MASSPDGRIGGGGRVLGFCMPPEHRYTTIAQLSTECCLEFTAIAVIECLMGWRVGSSPSRGAGQPDTLGRLDETDSSEHPPLLTHRMLSTPLSMGIGIICVRHLPQPQPPPNVSHCLVSQDPLMCHPASFGPLRISTPSAPHPHVRWHPPNRHTVPRELTSAPQVRPQVNMCPRAPAPPPPPPLVATPLFTLAFEANINQFRVSHKR